MLHNLSDTKPLEESRQIRRRDAATAGQAALGMAAILPQSFCSNILRNLVRSNRRFKVKTAVR